MSSGPGLRVGDLREELAAIGISEMISARKSPWQFPYVERVSGSSTENSLITLSLLANVISSGLS